MQQDECKTKCSRLDDLNISLEMELKCRKIKLEDANLHLTLTEEKSKLEKVTLANELEIKCQILREKETLQDRVKCLIKQEKLKSKYFEKLSAEVKNASEKECKITNDRIQTLEKEILEKEKKLYCAKNQLVQLQQNNECETLRIGELGVQLHVAEGLLEQMKCSSKAIEQINGQEQKQFEKEKKSLILLLDQKNKKISDLKNEACCLMDKIKEQSSSISTAHKNTCDTVDCCCCFLLEKYATNRHYYNDLNTFFVELNQLYYDLKSLK